MLEARHLIAKRMIAIRNVACLALLFGASCSVTVNADTAIANLFASQQQSQDYDHFCTAVRENYAYFDVKKTDWQRVCDGYRVDALAATTRGALVTVLERALGELYDAHAHLGSSTRTSPRLTPTNTDLSATWQGERAVIVSVRSDSAAFKAGAREGMTVLEVDGEAVQKAALAREPRCLSQPDPAAREWALQSVLAGRQNGQSVRLKVQQGERSETLEFVPDRVFKSETLSYLRVGKNNDIGLIRFNNSLGGREAVLAFDEAVKSLADTRALLLDLRDTPSGGNTTVARAIMGRLIDKEALYQRHEAVSEFRETGVRRAWVEYVFPRTDGELYRRPVIVLVGRWTGSMGEGLAIGLHAARGALVLGEPMAHLLGSVQEYKLPQSGIAVRIPTEKLFSVDGKPREAFVPCAVFHKPNDANSLVNGTVAWIENTSQAAELGGANGAAPCPVER
jgi:C-terminal processing protease CtpA/Prc